MTIALGVLAMSCSAASAQAATGLEPGVHIDPGSPAAKEYALPLNQARRTGLPRTTGSPAAVPFGAGIHASGGSAPRSSADGSSRHGTVGSGARPLNVSKANGGSRRTDTIPPAILRAANERAASKGNGSILALVGGGVAILVLGGFGGMIMRRSHRATPLA